MMSSPPVPFRAGSLPGVPLMVWPLRTVMLTVPGVELARPSLAV
jgi:hypothetical protein